jgi:hypothetical protein
MLIQTNLSFNLDTYGRGKEQTHKKQSNVGQTVIRRWTKLKRWLKGTGRGHLINITCHVWAKITEYKQFKVNKMVIQIY